MNLLIGGKWVPQDRFYINTCLMMSQKNSQVLLSKPKFSVTKRFRHRESETFPLMCLSFPQALQTSIVAP